MHPLRWLAERDRDLSALRRAGRTAIIMPTMFAIGDKVIGDPVIATFAAFGSFAMLLLVDFGGRIRDRLRAQASLAVVGAAFVCLGTLASQNPFLAAGSMAVVGFVVIFAGVVSSVLAAATTSLLLAFILPVSLAGSVSAIPARLAGWGLASVVAFAAIGLLWPAPVRDPLRGLAMRSIRAVANRLQVEAEFILADRPEVDRPGYEKAVAAGTDNVAALYKTFLATPYRPTGLSTSSRTIVRLVDEMKWLDAILAQTVLPPDAASVNKPACRVRMCAADALKCAADMLDGSADAAGLQAATVALQSALDDMERGATLILPVNRPVPGTGPPGTGEFISALDPTFRAQELSFAVMSMVANVDLTTAAEKRGWLDRLLGRQPGDLDGPLTSAKKRAAAHLEPHSVWLHNSVRGAIGVGAAVLVADLTGVQHSFWVVLATLSVLRSSALNTGQNAFRGLLGTVAGFVIGAGLLALIGTNAVALWVLLPIAILTAGLAPAVATFAAGQAAFTVVIVILFNLIQPAGWRVGLLRVEDIALGCAVSVVVGALFWPRGAGAAMGRALGDAYRAGAAYLADAVLFGMLRCDATVGVANPPVESATQAAAASRRLDDTFRSYLAERGTKPLPLADVTRLVTGTVAVRLAGDAVLDLWQRDDGSTTGDRSAARAEVLRSSVAVQTWYAALCHSLAEGGSVSPPVMHDTVADGRLIEAVRHDLTGEDGRASATAVRMIWTGDHLDAARRLEWAINDPARAAAAQRHADASAGRVSRLLSLVGRRAADTS